MEDKMKNSEEQCYLAPEMRVIYVETGVVMTTSGEGYINNVEEDEYGSF